jgi:DNA-binding NtrC family response regulator
VPALRNRNDDIEALTQHFITSCATLEKKQVSSITQEGMQLLKDFHWPGNIRQLKNAIFRAVVLSEGKNLCVEDFPQIMSDMQKFSQKFSLPTKEQMRHEGTNHLQSISSVNLHGSQNHASPQTILDLENHNGTFKSLEMVEKEVIETAIKRYHGKMAEVARRLKIGRSTLYRKLEIYHIDPKGLSS